ncbi:MAG: MATE family efflux transporter, partial [Syntrophomonadaceae bacterium]|nr:MATE family efflux transporter [Syntrophomonadaceae bacterium]
MLDHSVGILLVKLSFPAMAGMILYSLLNLVDVFFIARLGPEALAVMTISIPVQVLVTSMASATGVGVTSLIARTLGAGDIKDADNTAWHGIFISIFYGIIFVFLGIKYIDELLILFGCTPETFVMAKSYLRIILAGCIFTFIPIMLGSIIQGEGNTFLPILVALIGISLNVIFDPIFMFGLGPIEGRGLDGAAIASVLAQILSSLLLIVIVLKRRVFLTWSITNFRPGLKVLSGIYKVGFPAIIMEITGVVIMAFLNRVLGGYSYTAVAVLGIFLRIRSLTLMPVLGLTQGTMPITGFAYGAGNLDRVKEAIIKSVALSLLFTGAAWFIVQYYPLMVIDLFSNDPTLTVMGVTCLRLATIFLPLLGPILILYTAFQALGKGTTAMCLSVLRQLGLFLPLIIILPQYFSINGVWLAFSVSELLSG